MDLTVGLLIVAVIANALLVGASLDQSIKQLPARRRIGALAFSAYSQAADLGPGIAWLGALGIGAALLTLAAAIVGLRDGHGDGQRNVALLVAAVLTVAHSLVTARAAPTNFSQRTVAGDERALTAVFDRFERLQTIRAALQVLTLVAITWALVAAIAGRQ
jgi:hypothetical protein